MTKISCGIAVLGLVCLSACVPPSGRKQLSAADDPSNTCFNNIGKDARYAVLKSKMAIDVNAARPSLEMLAEKSVPTDEEKRALSSWLELRDVCFDAGRSWRAQNAPAFYSNQMAASVARVRGLTARLYTHEITYGEFNRQRADAAVAGQAQLAEGDQRLREAAAAEAERDRDRTAAAIQQMQQNQILLQQQQRASQPRQTNCTRFGNQVNCTTY